MPRMTKPNHKRGDQDSLVAALALYEPVGLVIRVSPFKTIVHADMVPERTRLKGVEHGAVAINGIETPGAYGPVPVEFLCRKVNTMAWRVKGAFKG